MSFPTRSENTEITINETVSLKKFPPMLRKLAKYILENNTPTTLSCAARALNMNIYSVNSTIYRAKKNGNDFQKFIDEQAKMILHQNKVAVYKAVVDGAVSGSSTAHNNQKLFAQLTGDLKDSGATTTHITLAIGINSHPNIQFGDEERGVIDVEPVIPRGK